MRKRIMIVKKERCNPIGCGGYLCMRVSPSNRAGKEAIVIDTDGKVKVNEEVITEADRISANKCPFNALHMINLPEALEENPIHRYPPNGFSLFQLPTPIFGKVVGIIGRNGIGKSTAMKIIAGVLTPNLGSFEKEASYKDLVEKFKGTEAQIFFEKLEKNEIKVSYKPQHVDMIPKNVKGTVRNLLEKVDEKKKLKTIIDELDLSHIMDRDISHISGGELQRVAIAATVLKKANLYLFDEPTSYLDIKQRVKVSRFIKKLADEDTAVMVIEHDLIILDYMTDLVHLMYGEEGGFGVCSSAKSTKAGINTYLEGYIRDENMRFRDSPIVFDASPMTKSESKFLLTEWDAFSHTLGDFTLNVNSGTLYKGDVVGVLGENGMGKTTLARIITGEIEKEAWKPEKLKISYKPQYLVKKDVLVALYLKDALKYEALLIRPLGIKTLLSRNVSELSGGELQRVTIAKCLSQEADLYVMDEPSAYLDVEQRLTTSKVINDFMISKGKTTLVIDHDLLFIDYISSSLMVFLGEPSIKGNSQGPMPMKDGMNKFLDELNVTFRRDESNNRPRINKLGSQKDKEQKTSGNLYYTKND